ncbi:MAG: hypothetical protein ACI4WY_06135 [Anaerovoracaceae bacterium]
MKSFWQCVLVFLLFFIAAAAVIQVDRQCREMTGVGGSVTAFADEAAAAAVQTAGRAVESAAASAEIIVEKVGFLG